MKVRNGYVSNSSSSSFVIWGKNAPNYILTIKDGRAIETEDMAERVWWKIRTFHDDNNDAKFVDDKVWKHDFDNGHISAYLIPRSLYNPFFDNIKDYKNDFIVWFCENYIKERFFVIEASDHEGETKYLEQDMQTKIYDYRGNIIIFNNH